MHRRGAKRTPTPSLASVAAVALTIAAAAERPEALCAQRADPFPESIEIVLDASGSMRGLLGDSHKMAVAKDFLETLQQELARDGDEPRLGLRVFGARRPETARDCRDTQLLVGVSDSLATWSAAMAGVRPRGVSALAYALERAAADGATTYVLVTDGGANCGGNACAVWRDVVGEGGNRRARLHVVAVAPDPAGVERLRCLSRAGSGSFTVLEDPADSRASAERLALVLRNLGRLDVRLSVGDEDPFPAPVLVHLPLTGEVVASFDARRPHAVPAGMYTVAVETSPPVVFERVLVLPGETQVLERSDFGSLVVELAGEARPRATVAVRQAGRRAAEIGRGATGEPIALLPGRYDLAIERGDSVAERPGVVIQAGRTTRVTLGGTGTLRVVAAGFDAPPPTRALVYGGGAPDTVEIGEAAVLPAGRYRLVVQSMPIYVTEDVVVRAGRESVAVVPETGILGVDLYGLDGLARDQRIDVREPLTGELYGTMTSGERRLVMPGTYRLDLRTAPPRSIDEVRVAPFESRIVEIDGLSGITVAEPAAPREELRLEVLDAAGRVLAEAVGRRPAVTVWPGPHRTRLWRGDELLLERVVPVAAGESARIDSRAP